MAETDLKIKDAPLSTNISGNARMAGSDGSGKPVAISLLQVYNFVNSTLKNDAYFAPKTDIPSKVSNLTNDLGYITSAALIPYALTANVPTKVSQLTNDSKFVSSDVTDALAKNVAENTGDIERLVEAHDTLGHAEALSLDLMNLPTVVGVPWFMIKEGAPSTTPVFIGQIYLDKTNKKVYFAFGVSSASDWIVLN